MLEIDRRVASHSHRNPCKRGGGGGGKKKLAEIERIDGYERDGRSLTRSGFPGFDDERAAVSANCTSVYSYIGDMR